ncbi:MAG: hypothetical protein MZV65_21055 [Chromatiales bacterium]|nr:hypothetical protein [Chromatiales bacterium]
MLFRSPFGRAGGRLRSSTLEDGMQHRLPGADERLHAPRRVPAHHRRRRAQGTGRPAEAPSSSSRPRLEAEGLFDAGPQETHPLPALADRRRSPRRSGAVIRDILTITRRRFPSVDILIAPVRVQGAEAPAEIIEALRQLNELPGIDVIILARGGGSLEDLAAFNDEGVARAIARIADSRHLGRRPRDRFHHCRLRGRPAGRPPRRRRPSWSFRMRAELTQQMRALT